MRKLKTIIFFLFSFSIVYSQSVNIIPFLKKIEEGKIEEVKKEFTELKNQNPNNANVVFLDAVLTEDGNKAQKIYELVYTNFPQSQFADAALFRSFSYFYSLGLYKRAETLKNMLKEKYPKSAYLKKTGGSFPEVDEMILVDSSPYKQNSKLNSRFTIQAGAFGDFKNAERLKTKLVKSGYHAKIAPKIKGGKTLHIVIVGAFRTKPEAEKFLDVFKSKYDFSGRVVKVE
ncbi:MAG: SPOR domain-containing protein [Melioribacteraceae bacterium]